jgi:hypothetical protein
MGAKFAQMTYEHKERGNIIQHNEGRGRLVNCTRHVLFVRESDQEVHSCTRVHTKYLRHSYINVGGHLKGRR